MLEREHLTRQMDIVPLSILNEKITVVGAGAIGSFLVLQLAKMGFSNIEVWDFDSIEVENMSSQFYRFSDIGKKKVFALRDLVWDFTEIKIHALAQKYVSRGTPRVLVSAVDSMKSRKSIWSTAKGIEGLWFIDPRMGAMDAALYNARADVSGDRDWYEKTLVSDEDAVQERCTAKATIFTANLLSGLTAKTIVNCLKKEPTLKSAQWSIKYNELICSVRDICY
jgi:hypothetical protein